MSFWTDIRDTIEAPFDAVGDFVDGVLFKHRPFDQELGKFGARMGAALFSWTPVGIITTAATRIDAVHDALNSDFANSITFGVSRDITHFSDFALESARTVTSGRQIGFVEARDAYTGLVATGLKIGAAVVTAGAAGAAAGGSSGVVQVGAQVGGFVSGASGVNQLERAAQTGNFGGIVSAATNITNNSGLEVNIPESLSDAVSTVAGAAQAVGGAVKAAGAAAGAAQGSAGQAQNLVDLAKSNTPASVSGYSSGTGSGGAMTGSTQMLMLGGAAVLLLILAKGRK